MLVKIQEDGGDTQDLGSDTAADLQRAKGVLSSGGIQEEKNVARKESMEPGCKECEKTHGREGP